MAAACSGGSTEVSTQPTPSETTAPVVSTSTTTTSADVDSTETDDSSPTDELDDTPPEDSPSDDVDPGLAAEIDELIDITEQIRGLEFLHSVDVEIREESEFQAGLEAEINEDLEPELIAAEDELLTTMGIIGPGEDLDSLYRMLLADQVLGYYDPETELLVIRDNGGGLSPSERSIVVHELVHALTDQYYDWGQALINMADDEAGDQFRALQIVGEGDATFHQTEYVTTMLSSAELAEFVRESLDQQGASEGLNPYLLESLGMPYTEGFFYFQEAPESAFQTHYEQFPASTEQLMERTDELPVSVVLPELAVPGYEVLEEYTVGQADWEVLFTSFGEPALAGEAARGWGGDRVLWLWNGSDVIEATRFVGDSELDAEEFESAFTAWFEALAEPASDGSWLWSRGYFSIDRQETQVDVVVASNAIDGAAVRAQMAG